jgi:hypothetical protein
LSFAATKGHPEIPLREAGIRCAQADFMPIKGFNNVTLGEFALLPMTGLELIVLQLYTLT